LRNTVIDLRYATAGQTFENAVSIRKLYTFSNPATTSSSSSSSSSSGAVSTRGAGSRRSPIDLTKDFQLFPDPGSPERNLVSLFPSENNGSKGKNEQKRKIPKKSQFLNSQTIKESPPVTQQDQFPFTMVCVMVKKPAERRVPQEVLSPRSRLM
jgi:hypothetical protein